MAIDSAEKRRSAAHITFAVGLPGVTPNTDKDLEWRREVARTYSFDETVVSPPTNFADNIRRRRKGVVYKRDGSRT